MDSRVSGCETSLARALTELNRSWEATAWGWRDAVREEFERKYLADIGPTVKAAQTAMKAVDDLLRQAIRECS